MSRWLVRGLAIVVGALALGVGALVLGFSRRFDVPTPQVRASHDPAVIERGRYLVYGPAACAYCHRPKSDWPALERGEALPLSGAHTFPLPFGTIYSSNLTADAETGIGAATDGELARVLRYNVRRDGHAAVPLMEFPNLSDEDLVAAISFLRTLPAVRLDVPPHDLTMTGRLVVGVLLTPEGPTRPPRASSPIGATVERGEYLANDVAACVSCHTDRGPRGDLVGPRFAGGQRMEFAGDTSRVLVTPNLTPDPQTGRVATWSEDRFISRFRLGTQIRETIMPWGAYRRMTDDDLRAVYRYLRTLPPVSRDTGPALQPRT